MSLLENMNSEIVFAVVKWGAITKEDLFKYLRIESKFSTFRVRIHSLISKKLIESKRVPSLGRSILCANEGTRLLAGNDFSFILPSQLAHDSGLSGICIQFFQFKNVYDVNLIKSDELANKSALKPDAELLVNSKSGALNIALEYELTQKSKTRIKQKYINYAQNGEHKHVIYFFENERLGVVYAHNLLSLMQESQHLFKNKEHEKFYFFVRNKTNDDTNFKTSFKQIYPSNSELLFSVLEN